MFKSLRYRILVWFVLSTLIISGSSFVFVQLHKATKLNQQEALTNLNFFKYQFLKDQSSIANFMANETTNEHFFITGESEYLFSHYKHATNIDSCYINCFNAEMLEKKGYNIAETEIRNTYTNYCILLDSLIYKIYKRGYKNYGLEGELASYMFKLEQLQQISSSNLNRLKIAEHQYIGRNDIQYIENVNQLCNSLITNTLLSNRYGVSEKKEIVQLIKTYKKTFNEIVEIDQEIGIGQSVGLRQGLSETGYQIEELVNSSIIEAQEVYQTNMSRINVLFGLSVFLLIGFAIALSVYTSRYLVENLEKLTNYINTLSKNNFNQRLEFNLRHSTNDIRHLYLEFRNMLADLRIRENQRDRALRIAEDNQQRYQELADLLPQCIYETDRMGNLTYVNKAWHKTFGYGLSDIDRGINLIEIINAAPNSSLFGFSKVENNDFLATRKNGEKFPATVYSDVIKKGIRVVGRRGIIIDATLRNKYIESLKKETARAVTSDKHKSSFLANMSHELRTPMNSIIGFTNMLASKEIPEEMKESFIDHIQTSSDMLLNLIDDIIDIAKIEDGQLKITKIDCNPAEIIESLVPNFEAYKNRAEKNHLEIRVQLPEQDLLFKTDSFRLKQILSNLMSNAIKFTEQGWVEIGVREKGQQHLEFYVEDSGIGMTKDDLRTIFDRFQQTKLSEEKKISGTGLGLAISKNLVEMLGGTMWVASEQSKGTRFTFELPYVRVTNPIVVEPVKNLSPVDLNWSDKKFLVAEDDDNGYTYIAHIFEKTKAQIIRARNGNEALEALSFHKDIDLVLMDLRMPVLDGLETTRRIKSKQPTLPIIAQTAFAMDGDRKRCIEAGCDDYITKPIDAQNLIAKINQFIQPNAAPANKTSNTIEKKSAIESKNSSVKGNNGLTS